MDIAIVSGKGGTGKTTIAVALSRAINRNVDLLDCDVEDPDIGQYIKTRIRDKIAVNKSIPQIISENCTKCMVCANQCKFNALAMVKDQILFFEDLCRSCGVCSFLCPSSAIKEIKKEIGKITIIENRNITAKIGELNINEQFGDRIVKRIKDSHTLNKIRILDCTPGASSLLLRSIYNIDYCIIVTEPTILGLNDLKLVIESIKLQQLKFGIIINKASEVNNLIREFAEKNNYKILLEIPFNRNYAEQLAEGKCLTDVDLHYNMVLKNLYSEIIKEI